MPRHLVSHHVAHQKLKLKEAMLCILKGKVGSELVEDNSATMARILAQRAHISSFQPMHPYRMAEAAPVAQYLESL